MSRDQTPVDAAGESSLTEEQRAAVRRAGDLEIAERSRTLTFLYPALAVVVLVTTPYAEIAPLVAYGVLAVNVALAIARYVFALLGLVIMLFLQIGYPVFNMVASRSLSADDMMLYHGAFSIITTLFRMLALTLLIAAVVHREIGQKVLVVVSFPLRRSDVQPLFCFPTP